MTCPHNAKPTTSASSNCLYSAVKVGNWKSRQQKLGCGEMAATTPDYAMAQLSMQCDKPIEQNTTGMIKCITDALGQVFKRPQQGHEHVERIKQR